MVIKYKPSFIRDFKKLSKEVQDETRERIVLFQDPLQHQKLRVHKLKGRLDSFYSFSVTYSHRIVFFYESPSEVVFLAIGDHEVYK